MLTKHWLGSQLLLSTCTVGPWTTRGLGGPKLCIVENTCITYTGPSVYTWFLGTQVSATSVESTNHRSFRTVVFTIEKKNPQITGPLQLTCVVQAAIVFHLFSQLNDMDEVIIIF